MNTSIFNNAWLINAQTYKALIYQARQNGAAGVISMDAKEITMSKSQAYSKSYETINGVAIISLSGVLTKDAFLSAWLPGGTSMRNAGEAFNAALLDTSINSIMLYIDSPGGTVDGTEELASLIYEARGKKPIIAYSDGQITSAAYWIGSAADKIYISGNTVQAGSIGVVAAHVDVSEQDRMFGEKITEITAGKYKRIAGSHAPLSEEGRSYLQEQVDVIYSVFVTAVAKNRNISEKKALAMADGKIFIGQYTVDIKLVDGIAAFDEVLQICSVMETQAAKETIPAALTQTFESMVYSNCQGGMQQQAAFSKAKEAHPALYEDFNRRLKTGQVGELFPGSICGNKIIR